MANFTNHPRRLRTGDISEDSYFYAIGAMLGVPPHRAPVKEMPRYSDFIRSTNLYKGDK